MSSVPIVPVDAAQPPLLSAANLCKRYPLHQSTIGRLATLAGMAEPKAVKTAVEQVSFSIAPGEMVGLIGSNGAGKSTLLRMMAGLIEPSEGSMTSRGHIAAITELGTGFHAEWTGRQNVEFFLRLHGLSADGARQMLPEIEQFADIGDYFDQPLRTCSSGMAMRVSFAAAALVPCEILIIDEALAVGDAAFVGKCFDHLELLRRKGVTIIMVTHRLDLVPQICSRALYLREGRLVFDGDPGEAARLYWDELFVASNKPTPPLTVSNGEMASIENGGGIAISDIRIEGGINGQGIFAANSVARVSAKIRFDEDFAAPVIGLSLRTIEGVALFVTNTDFAPEPFGKALRGDVARLEIDMPLPFQPGSYLLDIAAGTMNGTGFDLVGRRMACAELQIVGPVHSFGMINMPLTVALTRGDPG